MSKLQVKIDGERWERGKLFIHGDTEPEAIINTKGKSTAPQITRDLQRWANNRFIYRSTKWEDYVPRADGKTIKELYYS